MRLGSWFGRLGAAAALMIALALGLALWSGRALAGNVAHDGHAGHRHAASAPKNDAPMVVVMVGAGAMDRAPCHTAPAPSVPSCCAGANCLSMHVGLAVVSLFPLMAGADAPTRPAAGPLFAGIAAPPDLPPPRRG